MPGGREEIPLWDVESCDEDCRKTAIPSSIFQQHVAMMHADSCIGFTKEYEYITASRKCATPGEETSLGEIRGVPFLPFCWLVFSIQLIYKVFCKI